MFLLFGSKPKKQTDEKPVERKRNYVTMFTFSRDKLYFPIINAMGVDGQTVSLYVTMEFKIKNMEEFRRSDPTASEMMDELSTRIKEYRRQYRSKDYYAGGGTIILNTCRELLEKYYPCIIVGDGIAEVVNMNNSN